MRNVAGEQAVGSKIDDAVLIELFLLDAGLGSVRTENDIGRVGPDAGRNLSQLIRRIGQRRQRRPQFADVGYRAAQPARSGLSGGEAGVLLKPARKTDFYVFLLSA